MRIDNVGRQVFVGMGIFFFPPSRPPLRGPSDDHAFCLRELRSKQTKELHILHTYQDCLVVALRPDFRGEKLKAIGMLKKWSKHGTMCAAGYLSAIIQCQGARFLSLSLSLSLLCLNVMCSFFSQVGTDLTHFAQRPRGGSDHTISPPRTGFEFVKIPILADDAPLPSSKYSFVGSILADSCSSVNKERYPPPPDSGVYPPPPPDDPPIPPPAEHAPTYACA
jgi:hypothetical protein